MALTATLRSFFAFLKVLVHFFPKPKFAGLLGSGRLYNSGNPSDESQQLSLRTLTSNQSVVMVEQNCHHLCGKSHLGTATALPICASNSSPYHQGTRASNAVANALAKHADDAHGVSTHQTCTRAISVYAVQSKFFISYHSAPAISSKPTSSNAKSYNKIGAKACSGSEESTYPNVHVLKRVRIMS